MSSELLPADVANRADAELGAAWRRAEAALPERAELALYYDPRDGYVAEASRTNRLSVGQYTGGFSLEGSDRESAAAALDALTEALTSRSPA